MSFKIVEKCFFSSQRTNNCVIKNYQVLLSVYANYTSYLIINRRELNNCFFIKNIILCKEKKLLLQTTEFPLIALEALPID